MNIQNQIAFPTFEADCTARGTEGGHPRLEHLMTHIQKVSVIICIASDVSAA